MTYVHNLLSQLLVRAGADIIQMKHFCDAHKYTGRQQREYSVDTGTQ